LDDATAERKDTRLRCERQIEWVQKPH
jgi:hypothetical protein